MGFHSQPWSFYCCCFAVCLFVPRGLFDVSLSVNLGGLLAVGIEVGVVVGRLEDLVVGPVGRGHVGPLLEFTVHVHDTGSVHAAVEVAVDDLHCLATRDVVPGLEGPVVVAVQPAIGVGGVDAGDRPVRRGAGVAEGHLAHIQQARHPGEHQRELLAGDGPVGVEVTLAVTLEHARHGHERDGAARPVVVRHVGVTAITVVGVLVESLQAGAGDNGRHLSSGDVVRRPEDAGVIALDVVLMLAGHRPVIHRIERGVLLDRNGLGIDQLGLLSLRGVVLAPALERVALLIGHGWHAGDLLAGVHDLHRLVRGSAAVAQVKGHGVGCAAASAGTAAS